MAERIDDIISKEAFDQVAKMDKGLSELLKRFEGNANAVKLFNAALQGSDKMSQVTATIKQAASETAKLEAAQRQLAFANSEQGKELALLKVQIEENTRANKNAAKEMIATEGSVKQMNAQLIRLRGQWDNMSEALRKSPMGAELAKRINLVDTALKTLDSNTGRFQRNVGNYATATNSLSQVLREMPAFTYSAQTGILGLSNNLPILVDQFRAVQAQTGSAGSALKVFAGSLLSFPNILTIAIGLFTIFYKEIMQFVTGTKQASESAKQLFQSVGSETGKMEALTRQIDNHNLSTQERIRAAKELKDLYPTALKNYSAEEIAAGKAAGAIMSIRNALVAVAMARAYQTDLEKKAAEKYELERTLALKKSELMQAESDEAAKLARAQSVWGSKNDEAATENYNKATARVSSLKNEIRDLESDAIGAEIAMNSLAEKIGNMTSRAAIIGPNKATPKGGGGRTGQPAAGQSADSGSTSGWLSALTVTPGSPEEDELNKSAETIKKYFEKINDDMAAAFDDADREKMLGIKNTTDATKLAQEIQTETERKGAAERKKIKKEEEHQKRITVLENVAQMVKMAAEIMSIAADIDFQREMAQIEQRDKALSESYDKELKAIELSGKSKAQQEVDKRRLEAQTEAQRKRIDRDRIKAARKKAQSDKASDIANIITGTASAVVAALGAKPYGPQNIALASFTGAIGLANLARAAAAPLPQFAKGTNSAPGGLAVVSERGQELVIEPSGKKYLTPATESIINLPKGSKVIPNDELMKSVEQATMIKLGQGGAVTSQQYGDVMVEIFEQTLEENRKLRRVLEDKKMSVVINNNSEFDNWTKKYVK
jgi:hypothetical protein